MLQIEFHVEADEEFKAASDYYEFQQIGLGESFVQSIENALRRILLHPLSGAILVDDFRRYIVQRFPYAVIYRVEEERIFILAIGHLHRRPGYWSTRA